MANHKSALKRARQSELKKVKNMGYKTRVKHAVKEVRTAVADNATEQAKENLRITEERFKEQVSTSTDVLVAQTLQTDTMTNYYNALYDYKIAKAVLYRTIGQEKLE